MDLRGYSLILIPSDFKIVLIVFIAKAMKTLNKVDKIVDDISVKSSKFKVYNATI